MQFQMWENLSFECHLYPPKLIARGLLVLLEVSSSSQSQFFAAFLRKTISNIEESRSSTAPFLTHAALGSVCRTAGGGREAEARPSQQQTMKSDYMGLCWITKEMKEQTCGCCTYSHMLSLFSLPALLYIDLFRATCSISEPGVTHPVSPPPT